MYRNEVNEFKKELAQKVVKLRCANNLTQEEFSEKLGYQREHVAKVETGIRNISLNYISRTCIAFNISIDELVRNY